MTLRTKEQGQEEDFSWLSEKLLAQLLVKKSVYLLNGEQPIFDLLHPAIISCKNIFERSPKALIFRDKSCDWNLQVFKNKQEAEKSHIGIKSYGGFPWQISLFITESPDQALIHFGELGSVFLSRNAILSSHPEEVELHHHVLPIWLDYALSLELWGPAGKWTRFHQRLNLICEKHSLFAEKCYPGFYPLKLDSQRLSKLGFQGRLTETSYDLILAWDFPLSALVELEKVLLRGP